MDNSNNIKELFKIVNKLMGSNNDNPLPPGRTSEETAEDFAEFFLNKINKIQQLFMGIPPYQPRKTDTPASESFAPLTQEVRREIMGMKNKSCESDQTDTSALKRLFTVCLPTITQIVNMSLTKGDFNEDWKTAIIRPLLKNLIGTYTQKLQTCLELVLSLQTGRVMHIATVTGPLHLTRFHMRLQYRKNYSTETSLIKLTNNILWDVKTKTSHQ